MSITNDSIPLRSKDVVTRKDAQGILLFQVRTDEMHFITNNAFALFSLCDGSRTLEEIQDFVAANRPDLESPDGRSLITQFIESLAQRNILELV